MNRMRPEDRINDKIAQWMAGQNNNRQTNRETNGAQARESNDNGNSYTRLEQGLSMGNIPRNALLAARGVEDPTTTRLNAVLGSIDRYNTRNQQSRIAQGSRRAYGLMNRLSGRFTPDSVARTAFQEFSPGVMAERGISLAQVGERIRADQSRFPGSASRIASATQQFEQAWGNEGLRVLNP